MRKIFNLLCMFLSVVQLIAQNKPYDRTIDMFPKSPDAAALSKHIDIPSGSYTGVANFTIPLYTINLDGVQIPIELNYTTNGIKVGEIASRVGLGWSLNTGASLSQQVIGIRDVASRSHILIDWNFNPIVSPACTISGDYYKALAVTSSIPDHEYQIDLKPDIFAYGLLNGKSGKFILDANNETGVPIPYNSIKITKGNAMDIMMTDETGIRYDFSHIDASIKSRNTCYQDDNNVIFPFDPNYHLTQITSPKNNTINYYYDIPDGIEMFYVSSVTTQKRVAVIKPDNVQTPPPSIPREKCINYTRSTDRPLSEIIFPGGKILFTYNNKNEEPRLDINGDVFLKGMKVQDNANNIIKDYTFNYEYFESPGGIPTIPENSGSGNYPLYNSSYLFGVDHRLKLVSVRDNLNNNEYKLEYYETYNGKTLPNRISNDQDFWGVYNGKENGVKSISNSTYAPPTNVSSPYFGADKNPDIDYGILGNLKKIIYPTGGHTEIKYEADEFDLPEPEIVYEYEENNNSEIADNEEPFPIEKEITITANSVNQQIKFERIPSSTINTHGQCEWKLKKPDNTIETGFAQTTITRNDPPGNYILWVTKDLDNPNVKCSATYSWTDITKTPIDILYTRKTGTLRINAIESVDNNGGKIERLYTYKVPTENHILPYTKNSGKNLGEELFASRFTKRMPNNALPHNNGASTITEFWASNNPGWQTTTVRGKPVGYDYVQEYYIDSKNLQNSYRKEFKFQNDDYSTSYDPSSPVNVTWPGGGYDRGLVSEEKLFNSANELVKKTENFYDNDYSFNNKYSPTNSVLENIMGVGLEIIPITSESVQCGVLGSMPIVKFEYNVFGLENYWIKSVKTTTTDYVNNQPTLVTEQTTAYSTSNPKHTFPLEQKSEVVGSGVSSSQHFQYAFEKGNTYLTGKNIISIPLATEVKKNGKTISKTETVYPNSEQQAKERIINNTENKDFPLPRNVLSYNLDNLNITDLEVSYDFYDTKGNLLQYTTRNGISTAIIWDKSQRQPIAKVEGASYAQASAVAGDIVTASDQSQAGYTEANLLSKLDAFRNDTALSGFQITTYTYKPLIGVSSITPPSGVREVYVYDTANRLQSVVDANGKILKEYSYKYKQ